MREQKSKGRDLVYDWIMFPQNSCAKALTYRVTLFGDRAFSEVVKVRWGKRGCPDMIGLVLLLEETLDSFPSSPFSLSPSNVRTQWEGGGHLEAREGALARNWIWPEFSLGVSSFQNCCFSHPVYVILLRQPKQSKTGVMIIIRAIIDCLICINFGFLFSKVWVKSYLYLRFTGEESDD